MQTPDSESIDSTVPLFDVVISMPPGANLETIQRLAETEAGLPPERVERLIKVLRSTPNAKVGAGVSLERAEEEKTRFTKAGLLVEIQPLSVNSTEKDTRESVEASIRAQVPIDSEKKNNISKQAFFTGKAGLLISITLAVVMGLLYAGEKGVTIGGMSLPWGKKEAPLGAMSASSVPQVSTGSLAASGARPALGTAGVTAEELTGDADIDDMLIQAAAGKKTGGKTLTIEEALAAARTLTGAPVGGSVGAAAAVAADTVPKQTKQILTAEFASLLAEIGQGARAREVLKALAGSINPGADVQAASAFQAAQLKAQAWSVQRMGAGQAGQAAEELKAKTQAIANAQERAQLQGQVAVILSRNPQLAPDVPRMFLSLGAESLKAVGGAQNNASPGDLAVSMAEVFLNETTARAKAGGWTKAKASAAQVEDLIKQAPDAWAQSRLYAVDHQAKLQTGQTDKAAKSLESALTLAGKSSNLPERAAWLRSIAQLSADASTQEQFETVANNLQTQLNAKSGIEKARGLTELSLLYTAAGLPGKAAQLRSLAQATTGLSAADSVSINTDLLVRSDMAMAKMLHGLGRYAEAEAVLQRVGGYLF